MSHFHAVVWLDHREARVFQFNDIEADLARVQGAHPNQKLHHHSGSLTGKRTAEDHRYLESVVEHLKPAKEWLVMGPGSAKLELMKHVNKHHPDLVDHVCGVESADHPTDGQIIAHSRAYFKVFDAKLPAPAGDAVSG